MPITGGCLCGAVRFEATLPPRRVTHCHCEMCRRSVGAVVAPIAAVESPDEGEAASREAAPVVRTVGLRKRSRLHLLTDRLREPGDDFRAAPSGIVQRRLNLFFATPNSLKLLVHNRVDLARISKAKSPVEFARFAAPTQLQDS